MTLQAGAMLKQYRLVGPVGEGGMGVVWKAEDTVLGRTVALKVLPAEVSADEKRRRMFLDEARLASSLNDAHIATVHEFAREGDLDFIVMELVDGRPLTKLIQGRPLPPDKVADWGHQVGQALSRAHRKGLLHRDIKPANILVTPEGDVKVVDFGVAVLFDRSVADRRAAPSGEATGLQTVTTMRESSSRDAMAGTLPYMSPEQVRGEPLGVHSDIFSLGVVLYEMTTGQRPFAARTNDELADAISQARPTPVHDLVPTVPLDLDRIIHKALAAKPSDRYQTMEDMAVDLKRLGRDLESGTSPTYGDLRKPAAPGRGLPAGWIVGAVAGVILILGGAAVAVRMLGGDASARGTVPVGESTVLVLPLEVRGQAEGAGYVGQTFAEAVAISLAQARNLKILPVPEERAPRGADRAALARERGAGLLLTGSLTRDGQVIHASLSMVDTVEGHIVWGAQRNAPEGELASLATNLAREGVEALGTSSETIYKAVGELGSSPALASSQLTAEALGALHRREVDEALEATGRLVTAFPSELEAHVLRAEALRILWRRGDQNDELRRQLEATAAAMERIDPESPYHAFYRSIPIDDHRQAMAMLDQMLERDDLSPWLRYDALSYRGWRRRNAGEIQGAVEDLEAAVRLFPADAGGLSDLGYILREAGRTEEGLRRVRQAVALEPSAWWTHMSLGHVLSGMERFQESARAYMKACDLARRQRQCAAAAGSLLQAGDPEKARLYAEMATAMPPTSPGTYNMACYHAQAGDLDQAFAYLNQSLELGWASTWLAEDPDLEPLHGDPRWEETVRRAVEVFGGAPERRPAPAGPTGR